MADFVGQVLRQLQDQPGITVEKSQNSGHWKVLQEGHVVTTVPSTMYEGPAAQAVLASLRKAGVDLVPRQPKSTRPKRHRPKRHPAPAYTKKTAGAAVDELRRQLDELGRQVRAGDRDPAFYERVQAFVCGVRRDLADLTDPQQ